MNFIELTDTKQVSYFRMLAQCVAKNRSMRFNMGVLAIDRNSTLKVKASDGMRAAWINDESIFNNIPDGHYRVLKNAKKTVWLASQDEQSEFPPLNDILIDSKFKTEWTYICEQHCFSTLAYYIAARYGTCLKQPLLAALEGMTITSVRNEAPNKPVQFDIDEGAGGFIQMPMRADNAIPNNSPITETSPADSSADSSSVIAA